MAQTTIVPHFRPGLPPWLRIVVGLVLLVVLIGLLTLSGAWAKVRQVIPGLGVAAPTYQTTTIQRGNVTVGVTATGPVAAGQSVPLSFKSSGKLAELKVNVGEKVTKGQVLGVLDTADLQTALEQAKAALAVQQANLEKLQNGPTQAQVGVAQTSVENAKQAVGNAQANLQATQSSSAQDFTAAQASAESAATGLASAQRALGSAEDQAAKGIAADQVALANAQKNLNTAKDQEAKGLAADQTSVANAQKNLDAIKATLAANAPVQQQQIEKAKDDLWSAQISRDAACGRDKGATCQAANATVASAQTALNLAQSQLDYNQKQGAQQIATAQAQLDQAKAQLANDQAKFAASIVSAQNGVAQAAAQLSSDQSKLDASVVSARNQVNQAQATLNTAQAGIGQAQAKATQSAQSAQAQVDQAAGTARSAEASYNQTVAPALPSDIDAAKAQVSSAQAAVDAAQNNLAAATLVAPFDGTVASINGAVGQWITGGATSTTNGSAASTNAFITLLDTNALQVTAQVNEADISKVKIGDPVSFNVEAYPNKTFTGKVLEIQPVGTTVQNVVNYNVTSSITSVKDAVLYPGMTATVTIVSAEQNNVSLVPNSALTFAQTALRQGLVQRNRAGGPVGSNAATPVNGSARTGGQGGSQRGNGGQPGATGGSRPAGQGGFAAGGQRQGNFTGGTFDQGTTQTGQTNPGIVLTLENGQLTPVRVTLGLTDGSQTQVVSGLNPGDVVVVGMNDANAGSGASGAQGARRPGGSPFGGGFGR